MINLMTSASLEDKHLSSSLMEKILSVSGNSLVEEFLRVYKTKATGKGIKNVTINKAGEMTFLPKGKECKIAIGLINYWDKTNRQSGSFGKILRKLLVENGVPSKSIDSSELEQIVNSLKADYTVEGNFVIVCGKDITKYYLHTNYDEEFNIGTMEHSCMRHAGPCQRATELYADSENCEMVILKSPKEDKSRGRALLWTDVDGQKWLDRIYACDHVAAAFKKFAHSNGWAHKRHQDSNIGAWVFPGGDVKSQYVYIDMNTDYSPLPYMDTFYYLSNHQAHNNEDDSYEIHAQNEPEDDGVWDAIDEEYIDEDVSIYVGNRNFYTHVNNCFHCPIELEWFVNDEAVTLNNGSVVWNRSEGIRFIESKGEYYRKEDAAYCYYNDDWYPEEDVEFVDDLDTYVFIDNVDDAYEEAGWVKDDKDSWLDPQYKLI